jgi:Mrp family chromosome partitioning ATPase
VCQHCKQYSFECTFFLPITETRFKKKRQEEEAAAAAAAAEKEKEKRAESEAKDSPKPEGTRGVRIDGKRAHLARNMRCRNQTHVISI